MDKKTDKYFIDKILTEILFVTQNLENVSYDEFKENVLLSDSVCFRLIQISELSKRISIELIKKEPEIPWHQLTGLRNRIVHDYGNVDLKTVYVTAKEDLKLLGLKISKIISSD